AAAAIPTAFWQLFGDATLTALVERTLAANTDLGAAVARLQEARALARAAGSQRWPRLDLSGAFTNSRFSENGFLQGLGGAGAPGAVFPGQEINLYQLGFDASWELDLFGGNRRAVEAADAEVEAVQYDARALVVSLAAEVTDGYLQLRSLQTRLQIAEHTVAAWRASLLVLDEQVAAGVAGELDQLRARSELARATARLPELEAELQVAIHRLEALAAKAPGALDPQLRLDQALPPVPDALAVDIPAAAVRQRPDVQAAERRLAAATARIGVATAELYPRFSLTGAFGLQSQQLEDLPRDDSRFWSIGPQLRWPLLDFGRVRAGVAAADARTQQALCGYEGTVTRALADVEVALVRINRGRRQLAELLAAAAAARQSVALAQDLYRNGLLEFLALLDAQRTLDQDEDQAARQQAELARQVVALCKALGGGWQATMPADAATAAPQAPAAGH
ncbi:MAG TPA: efflux transporter outer membrane subunit, partial [Planctomycetota bacterium]|nr:efflux transporter outer membrane subunit [Planctomycetota bacterium]